MIDRPEDTPLPPRYCLNNASAANRFFMSRLGSSAVLQWLIALLRCFVQAFIKQFPYSVYGPMPTNGRLYF